MFAYERRLVKNKGRNSSRATLEATTALYAGKPYPARCLFSKATCPGIIIIKYRQVTGMLVTKDIGFGLSIILHTGICIEMVRIDVCHDSNRRAECMRSQALQLPARQFQDNQGLSCNLRQQRKRLYTGHIASQNRGSPALLKYFVNKAGRRRFTTCACYPNNATWTGKKEEGDLHFDARAMFTSEA